MASDADEAAAKAFCAREHPRLVAALTYRVGDRRIAEELAQEALLRACASWARVGQLDSPGGWTWHVARNLAASHRRRRQAERRAYTRHGPPRERHVDPQPGDPDLAAALGRLPDRQRDAVVLRHVLDRLRAEPPAPTPLDVDALWEAGRRRRRRSTAAVASTTLTALLVVALVVPGHVDLSRPGVAPILDQPDAGPAGGAFLTDEAIWVAPPGDDPHGAADLFAAAIETGWDSQYTAGGVDAADQTETTIAVGEGTIEGSERDGASMHVHLFRGPEDRDRWHVVAVDSNVASLTRQDGRAVVPLEPVPSGAVEVTVDRRTADGTDTVTVPVADLPEEVRGDLRGRTGGG